MRIYIFPSKNVGARRGLGEAQIVEILKGIGETSNTDDLVVAIYFIANSCKWRGFAYKKWLTSVDFHRYTKRNWAVVRSYDAPKDLPERFKLIRMAFGISARYPKRVIDRYGWGCECHSFKDHLAIVFAHELHHYRRYHLGLHPGEGEQSACKWGFKRASECGFTIRAERVPRPKRRKRKAKEVSLPQGRNPKLLTRAKRIVAHLSHEDLRILSEYVFHRRQASEQQQEKEQKAEQITRVRNLPKGARLRIRYDKDYYSSPHVGTVAMKIRNLRSNSDRMVIKTTDGKIWRWPMAWLEPVESCLEDAITAVKPC